MGKLNDQFLRRNENLMRKSASPPPITNTMVKSVSEERRVLLEGEVNQGLYRDGNGSMGSDLTPASLVTSSIGMKKSDQVVNGSQQASSGCHGSNNRLRQPPEIQSPFGLN